MLWIFEVLALIEETCADALECVEATALASQSSRIATGTRRFNELCGL